MVMMGKNALFARQPAGAPSIEEFRSPGCLFAENRDLQLRVEQLQEENAEEKARDMAMVWDREERLRQEMQAHQARKCELQETQKDLASSEQASKDREKAAERWCRANDRAQRRNQELFEQVRETERLRSQEVTSLTRQKEAAESRAEQLERQLAEALEREERLKEALAEENQLRGVAEEQVVALTQESADLQQTLGNVLATRDADIAVVRNAHRAQLEARFLKKNFGVRGSAPPIRF